MPMIAAIVIVVLTLFLAVLSRWRRIMRVTMKHTCTDDLTDPDLPQSKTAYFFYFLSL